MTRLPLIDEATRDLAIHGSYCPKLCSHTCPVLAATGRDEATPWSLHRVVAAVATGERAPDEATGAALHHCTGCGACATACAWDEQDVPAQVRAGRAAVFEAGAHGPIVAAAVDHVGAGRTPTGGAPLVEEGDTATAEVVIVAGCRDESASVAALSRIIRAAGRTSAVVVPDGCCGARLDDLGARAAAATAGAALGARVATSGVVVAIDPHCLPSLRAAGVEVVDAVSFVHGLMPALPALASSATGPITWHDPCLLARGEGVVDPPRRLLADLGYSLVEPEGTGTATVCSGAGMGYDLLEPSGADEVAAHRAAQLTAASPRIVTACSGARSRLAAAGADVTDLFTLIADHLEDDA